EAGMNETILVWACLCQLINRGHNHPWWWLVQTVTHLAISLNPNLFPNLLLKGLNPSPNLLEEKELKSPPNLLKEKGVNTGVLTRKVRHWLLAARVLALTWLWRACVLWADAIPEEEKRPSISARHEKRVTNPTFRCVDN